MSKLKLAKLNERTVFDVILEDLAEIKAMLKKGMPRFVRVTSNPKDYSVAKAGRRRC